MCRCATVARGPFSAQAGSCRAGLLGVLLFIGGTLLAGAAEFQWIHSQTSAVATNLPPLRQSPRWNRLNLSISLPLRDREGLTNLLQQLYDPASTNYHRFLTPEQFKERFGPTEPDYEAVVTFARTHGLAVTARHPNRTVLSVRATVADVERAFHVTISEYQHPVESRTFFAPDREPSVDLATPLLAVGGLDNYVIPHPCMRPMASRQAGANLTGSGPSGAYVGKDFRAAYVPGAPETGTGQTVGLLEFDSGYYQNDITAYETLAGLPNVPVSPVLLDGYNGGAGGGNDEVSLDIEMAISMAPGLSGVLVYEGSTTDDILNRMATDDLAKQIGASWTYPTDAGSEQAFLQMAAQGQSFFNASGDSDAYPGAVPTPADDPNITVVGGTTLTTTGPGGAWSAETVWNWGTEYDENGIGSSGGISTRNAIPVWQQGINMSTNQGSTTMRNLPDVAMTADNVYVIYGNGRAGAFGGTSCATPLWAAFISLVNQLALTNGEPAVGFINPAFYGLGKGSNVLSYPALFHDITTGNNESSSSPNRFSAVAGYDLCTGWGTPMGTNLITALGLPEPLRIVPSGSAVFTGPVGGPFTPAAQIFTLINNGSSSFNWALGSTSAWFKVTPTSGTLTGSDPGMPMPVGGTPVAVSVLPVTTNLPPGSYSATIGFTNLADGFVETRQAVLDVVTPPVITGQPTNEALLIGMTANFNVSIGTNALMFYQWQKNGTGLSDGGNISGSATSRLAISGVTSNDIGAYSVSLSNAAGTLASSNALLTIVPSAPVIVEQPTNQSVLPGAPAGFSVAAIGNTPYSYRWQFNGTNLTNGLNFTGVTGSTLVLSNVSSASAGIYSVIVSNSLGSVTSTGADLSVISVTAPGVAMSTLWSFTDGTSGELLYSPLIQARDGNLYGTTIEGGTDGDGTIFRLTTNGALTTFFYFNGNNGAIPYGGLFQGKDNLLYGTAFTGGSYGDGVTFRVIPGGSFYSLATFNGENGSLPVGGMIQASDGNLYGTTLEGGSYNDGTVFRMTTQGGLTTLAAFNGLDGADPSAVLVQGADGNLYGTTEEGGTNGAGTIFKITPAGALTTLYTFTGLNDGAIPIAGLVQGVDGNFYGVTYLGGVDGFGTVFELTPSGAFTVLYSFTGGADGASPWGGLMQARDGNLYGTTTSGGTYGYGTVFQIAPGGWFNTLVQFEGYNGASPGAAMIQGVDGNLYGTTEEGGGAGDGTVYRIGINGPLQITGQPADQSAYIGGTATFTVATTGGSPVYYQWQQDGVNLTDGGNISGSATATLRITNVAVADAALYSVVVSNAFDSLTSDYADLGIVYSPPNITGQPVSQTRVAGTTAAFSVSAAGDQPLSYQWQENGVNLTDGGKIAGSATATLTVSSVTATNSGIYSVIVSNALFAVSSAKAALTVVPATSPSTVQTEIHLFAGEGDGAFPYAGLIQGKDGNLYGTAAGGGGDFFGNIFRLSLSGSFSTVYSFTDALNSGANPYARLVQGTNGNFYGTAAGGGTNGYGVVFKMTTGLAVSFPYSFTGGVDGADPQTGLTQGPDGNFYGTSYEGGANALGCIYKMTPTGALVPIYAFTGAADGEYPYADLVLGRDGKLYGTTLEAGQDGYGTVFSVTTNGALTTLVSFNFANGAYPEAGLIQGGDGGFYGTTYEGGSAGEGTVFRLATNGLLTTLCSFAGTNGSGPAADLLQASDGNLYGSCSSGGVGGQGTVFQVTTNGTLTTLIWFDGLNGADPASGLVQVGNGRLYGTTPSGGTGFNPSAGGGYGTLYQIVLPIFTNSPFPASAAIACLPYSNTIVGKAIAPSGDFLTYGKVSGPAWLYVATNGILSGTPTNSDIGTNVFVVSLTDTNGVYATATMNLVVVPDPAPYFLASPFAEPWANLGEDYEAKIATNATAQYLSAGDLLTFGKVSGPAWLNVGADGALSGIPDGVNAGTNLFVVSVTDLGGSSNTATLFIYVNSPPMFEPQIFSGPPAMAGAPYGGTIATNAVDPDLAAGDSLSFFKVTGASWLEVAANGTLSGTPTNSDIGTESFFVLVVDSGGLAGVGTLSIVVNPPTAPLFLSNPFNEPPVAAGQQYSATIATNATDRFFGSQLTFSKVSGPAWLNVGANGSLSGEPLSTNAGTNSFVVKVLNPGGLSSNATLVVNVTAVPVTLSVTPQGGQLLLGWSGGVPPYQVQVSSNLAVPGWLNLGGATSATNLIFAPASAGAFYRVQGQ